MAALEFLPNLPAPVPLEFMFFSILDVDFFAIGGSFVLPSDLYCTMLSGAVAFSVEEAPSKPPAWLVLGSMVLNRTSLAALLEPAVRDISAYLSIFFLTYMKRPPRALSTRVRGSASSLSFLTSLFISLSVSSSESPLPSSLAPGKFLLSSLK